MLKWKWYLLVLLLVIGMVNSSPYFDYVYSNQTDVTFGDWILFNTYLRNVSRYGEYIFSWNITSDGENSTYYFDKTYYNYTTSLISYNFKNGFLEWNNSGNAYDPSALIYAGVQERVVCFNYTTNHTILNATYNTEIDAIVGSCVDIMCRNTTISTPSPNMGFNTHTFINSICSSYKLTNYSLPNECLNDSGGFVEICLGTWGASSYVQLYRNNLRVELSDFDIPVNITKNINVTKDNNNLSWKFYSNSSIDIWNNSNETYLRILKVSPVGIPLLLNKPLASVDDLICNITFSDVENDTWLLNSTWWWNNSELMPYFNNYTKILAGNTTDDENWTCEVSVWDGFNWSDKVNDTINIGDILPPNINFVISSRTTALTTDTVTFSANVTDSQSLIYLDSCNFELYKSDLAVPTFNITTNVKSSDIVSRTLTLASIGAGILLFNKAYCQDSNGNVQLNNSIGLSLSISNPPTGTGGGGGLSSAQCELNLFQPKAGGLISMFSSVGAYTRDTPFTIKNTGDEDGNYVFSITDNDYLKENCRFNQTRVTIKASLAYTNMISCKVDDESQTGKIQIDGCGSVGNYELYVGSNRFIGFFSNILRYDPIVLVGLVLGGIFIGSLIISFIIRTLFLR